MRSPEKNNTIFKTGKGVETEANIDNIFKTAFGKKMVRRDLESTSKKLKEDDVIISVSDEVQPNDDISLCEKIIKRFSNSPMFLARKTLEFSHLVTYVTQLDSEIFLEFSRSLISYLQPSIEEKKTSHEYIIGLKIFRYYIEGAVNITEQDITNTEALWLSDRWKSQSSRK